MLYCKCMLEQEAILKKMNNPYKGIDDLDKTNVFRNGRKIYFFNEITSTSVCEFFKLFETIETEKTTKPIEIILNSNGGSVLDGLAMYDKIRQSPKEIIIRATGFIASMAIIILLAGDYRTSSENTTFMTHQTSDEAEGKLSDVEISVKETKRLEDLTVNIIAEHTGQNLRKIKNDIKLGDCYFNAETALEDGYIQEIILNKKIVRKRRKRTTK